MGERRFADINVGDELPRLRLEPLTRLTFALYCGGSNDHNPIHVDSDFAKAVGLGDVIGHGMLSMALVGRFVTSWISQERLRSFQCRFVGMTRAGDVPVLSGRVAEKLEMDGERRVRLELSMENQHGDPKVRGEAVVAVD